MSTLLSRLRGSGADRGDEKVVPGGSTRRDGRRPLGVLVRVKEGCCGGRGLVCGRGLVGVSLLESRCTSGFSLPSRRVSRTEVRGTGPVDREEDYYPGEEMGDGGVDRKSGGV